MMHVTHVHRRAEREATSLSYIAALALVLTAGAGGCAARAITRPWAVPAHTALPANGAVLLLAPSVRFEDMVNEREMAGDYDQAALAQRLGDAAAAAFDAFPRVDCRDAAAVAWQQLCEALAFQTAQLARGRVKADARAALANGCARHPDMFVMADSLLAKIGPPDRFDPNIGQKRPSSASTVLHAALIDCARGDVVWKNDVLLRDMPGADDERHHEALRLLFGGAGATRDQH